MAVIGDDAEMVKEQCDFNTRQKAKSPFYLRLSQEMHVFSDYDNLTITCNSVQKQTLADCNPCSIALGCGCQIKSLKSEVVRRTCVGNITFDSDILYAVNMIVLQHFYDVTNVSVSGKALMATGNRLFPAAIRWKLYGEKVNGLLAADDTASYSLKKLALSLQNDSTVFHTPAEAILSDIIHEQANHKILGTDLSIVNSIVIFTLVLAISILALMQFRTRREISLTAQTVGRLGVTAALLSSAKAQIIPLKQGLPTAAALSAPVPVIEYLRDDTISFIINAIMFGTLLLIILAVAYWTVQMKSYVYIEIQAGKETCLIYYKRLPNAHRGFHIVASKASCITVVDCCLFGFIKFTGKPWKIEEKRTNIRTSLPRRILLTRGETKRVKALLQCTNCQVGPMVVHTHEFVRRFMKAEYEDEMESLTLV